MKEPLETSGPYLSAAFICEKVLVERDGVHSFIRVVDRFTIPIFSNIPVGVNIPPPVIQGIICVGIKGGGLPTGKYTITVKGHKPDGAGPLPDAIAQFFFPGGEDNGVILPVPLALTAPAEGLYWFDVLFEGIQLTRIPMRVLHQPAALPQFPQGPSPGQ